MRKQRKEQLHAQCDVTHRIRNFQEVSDMSVSNSAVPEGPVADSFCSEFHDNFLYATLSFFKTLSILSFKNSADFRRSCVILSPMQGT